MPLSGFSLLKPTGLPSIMDAFGKLSGFVVPFLRAYPGHRKTLHRKPACSQQILTRSWRLLRILFRHCSRGEGRWPPP